MQLLRCESVAEFVYFDVLQERLQLSSVVIKSFKGPHAIPELQQRLFTEKRFKNTNFSLVDYLSTGSFFSEKPRSL